MRSGEAIPVIKMRTRQGGSSTIRLRDALDAAGLLLTTGAGTRVTPDLLSDHLGYDACYDGSGQSRTFAERLLASFSPGEFPKLLQHPAEAEWRAVNEKPGAASVIEPLWTWFRARFEQSPFHERRDQIREWGNIAHLQPERTLQLAELALSLTTAPEPENRHLRGGSWDSHENSIVWLPKISGLVAEHHPEFLARCFDVLWKLGKDKPTADFNDNSHPLPVMSDVMTFKHWKRLEVERAGLDWMERLCAGNEWLHCAHKPAVLFDRILHPLFATSIAVNWSSARTVHFGSVPPYLENTHSIREGVRMICRSLRARPRLPRRLPSARRVSPCTLDLRVARAAFGHYHDSGLRPDSETVVRFLSRFESLLAVKGYDIEDAFEKLAEAFPARARLDGVDAPQECG
jgi:hypothetical protein